MATHPHPRGMCGCSWLPCAHRNRTMLLGFVSRRRRCHPGMPVSDVQRLRTGSRTLPKLMARHGSAARSSHEEGLIHLDCWTYQPVSLLASLAATELAWFPSTRDEALHRRAADCTCETSPEQSAQRRCRTRVCSLRCRHSERCVNFLLPLRLKIDAAELRH